MVIILNQLGLPIEYMALIPNLEIEKS